MKKAFNTVGNILMAILTIILLLNIIIIVKSKLKPNELPGILGYKPFVVLSGSMKSTIDIGDLIIIKDIDASKLKLNDIVAYKVTEKTIVTHRIVNVINSESGVCFETKGDSNNVKDDNLVCSDRVVGKYIYGIPKLGNAIIFIQKPVGIILILVVILSASAVIYLIENNRATQKLLKDKEKELSRLKK